MSKARSCRGRRRGGTDDSTLGTEVQGRSSPAKMDEELEFSRDNAEGEGRKTEPRGGGGSRRQADSRDDFPAWAPRPPGAGSFSAPPSDERLPWSLCPRRQRHPRP